MKAIYVNINDQSHRQLMELKALLNCNNLAETIEKIIAIVYEGKR